MEKENYKMIPIPARKYTFLAIYINNNSIYGFEVNEEKYYNLMCERKYILNHIDQKIARKFKNMEKQDVYTYLLKDNKKCAFELFIFKYRGKVQTAYNLIDPSKYFEKYLDPTLFKPVSEWNKDNNTNDEENNDNNEKE